MSITAVTSNPLLHDLSRLRRDAARAMEKAVDAGDIAGAQQDLAFANQAALGIQSLSPSSSTVSGVSTNATISADMAVLASAVQGGDLAAARSALAQLRTDRAAQAATSNVASGGTLAADLTALLKAAEAGDSSAALAAAQTLASDMQAQTAASYSAGVADGARTQGHRRHHDGGLAFANGVFGMIGTVLGNLAASATAQPASQNSTQTGATTAA